ncbi:DUF5805 domain-containing protein [Halorarius litoreus]|uniref:DUF5805 domain-containing protein n=1 Tax=Halorarius litoreus TaxID=2962676 RepID=UPI0020CDA9E9|nr:DUF5805 domain-containing protein [Halorarius litoreus]
MDSEQDTGRTAVRTYVPEYQKSEWKRHADELGMSQAEFVRTMVQAGRRGFEFEGMSDQSSSKPAEDHSPDVTPGVDGLERQVLELLESGSHLSWEELVAGLTDDIEDRLDETLGELQQENRIQYSGRHGGYTVVGDGE